ncbi:MAG: hypothetical protein Q8936_16715 [Bacillota bacterium]|nr:hypothetical protein [Bacillota bacterium]
MNEISTIIGIAFGITGGLIGIASYFKSNKKEVKQEVSEDTYTKAKLEYICKGVDDIRLDIKDHARQLASVTENLIRVEESVKSAHKRIDGIERKEEM